MSAPLLAVDGLDKHFGGRVLFDAAHLALESGSGYVLSGANGSGKTTLLRIIAGLEPAQRGQLCYNGVTQPLASYPPAWRRQIVYVHQQPYLFHTSIEKNLAYGLRQRGVSTDEMRSKVDEALQWAGLAVRRDVPAHKLSSGEKQRAALARAKVLDATLLLLDEPTANLDGDSRGQVLELVTALCIENHTVVVASHDPEILRLAILNRLRVHERRIVLDE
jgi:tungstate transport system ATP-binding protein